MKTVKNNASVTDYINSTETKHQADGKVLLKVFKNATGCPAKMWGSSIVGYGSYTYKRADKSEHEFMATGFSLRKSGPVLYIMPGYTDHSEILQDLGPHKLGKSCLYLKNLEDIDLKVLTKLIKTGLKDLKNHYPVTLQ